MKVIFTFLISLALGFCVFFVGVMSFSASLLGEGSLPDATEIIFEESVLEINGYDWHLPLIGGKIDKQMASPSDLTVQKLGTVTTVQPVFTLPDWVNYGEVTVTNDTSEIVFAGTLEEYEAFSYPANGDYKVTASFWHLPSTADPDAQITTFGESNLVSFFCLNSGLETPAQATGYYSVNFRFTLSATAILTLSSDNADVGSVIALQIDGLLGEEGAPTIETDLGDVTALAFNGGYRAYIPITYNASSGVHTVTVTVDDEIFETEITVNAITHDKVTLEEEEYSGTTAESEEYRTVIWPLYTDESTEKAWMNSWTCPVTNYSILVDFSDAKYYDNAFIGYSNCIIFSVAEESNVTAPAAGTVVYAGYLGLTGYTVVIDHGHGVRSYFYELASITVAEGDVLIQNQTIATTGETVTLDIKIGNKSISPWQLFRGTGGMFWEE